MPDYSKTIIYQISCKDESIKEKYIGHTTNFINRVQKHKDWCNPDYTGKNRHYNIPVYKFIRNNGGWDNWIIEIILEYPCENVEEATLKEREYILMLGDLLALNVTIPHRTKKEWKLDNAEHVNEYNAEYNKRPEHIQKQKEYDALQSSKERKHEQYEERCEIIKERTSKKYHEGGEKERRIQDRIDNPEKWKDIDRINNAKRIPKPKLSELSEEDRLIRQEKQRIADKKCKDKKKALKLSIEVVIPPENI